jgi:hypothetical protein
MLDLTIDAYTIRAVGQEEFSDVQVPDTPTTTASTTTMPTAKK